jgi:hypothetical protein
LFEECGERIIFSLLRVWYKSLSHPCGENFSWCITLCLESQRVVFKEYNCCHQHLLEQHVVIECCIAVRESKLVVSSASYKQNFPILFGLKIISYSIACNRQCVLGGRTERHMIVGFVWPGVVCAIC